jgi:hypothetical protein
MKAEDAMAWLFPNGATWEQVDRMKAAIDWLDKGKSRERRNRDVCSEHISDIDNSHDWLVGVEIVLGEHYTYYTERGHNPAPAGWVNIVCASCGQGRQVHEEDSVLYLRREARVREVA